MRTHRQARFSRPAILAASISSLALAAGAAAAAPAAAPGYSLSVFADPLAGSSAPDSIAVVGSDVFVGYGNGGDAGGAGGATSTIAEYNASGALLGSLTVTGHNDGLRYNAQSGKLWAIQNEDASPNLVLINPNTLAASAPLSFSATPHGGGYDDVAFGSNFTYVSASNPASPLNYAPAIVEVGLGANQVSVTGVALSGAANATVINPGGGTTTLNLQDPDSLTFGPGGQLVLDSQSDQQLVFIGKPGTGNETVSVLNLKSTVDDTVFGSGAPERLLFTDRGSGIVYALTGAFGAGQAISAADTLNQIASVNLSTGDFTALVTGLNGPHGEAFIPAAPEPSTWAMLLVGVGLVGGALRAGRRRIQAIA